MKWHTKTNKKGVRTVSVEFGSWKDFWNSILGTPKAEPETISAARLHEVISEISKPIVITHEQLKLHEARKQKASKSRPQPEPSP